MKNVTLEVTDLVSTMDFAGVQKRRREWTMTDRVRARKIDHGPT